jgi:regulator of ribosome biosynthesis
MQIPKAKPMTRWEKFAKEKGIKKTKKSRKVFDEETKEWIPAWGYQGANNKEDWVKEVPAGADPYEDQFEKAREEKVERVSKNKRQQQRNLEKNGMAADKTNAGGFSTLAARNNDVRQKRKMELQETIKTVRGSTASLGRFDKKIESEEKIVKFAGEKRKVISYIFVRNIYLILIHVHIV